MQNFLKDLDNWKDDVEKKEKTQKKGKPSMNYPIRGVMPGTKEKRTGTQDLAENNKNDHNKADKQTNIKAVYSNQADLIGLLEIDKFEANEAYKQRNYDRAMELYEKVISSVDEHCLLEKEDKTEHVLSLYISVYSNLSQCLFNKKKYSEVIRVCKKILSLNSNHLKSLFRIGRAFKRFKDYKNAGFYFEKGVSLSEGKAEQKEFENELNAINRVKERIVTDFKKSLILSMPVSSRPKKEVKLGGEADIPTEETVTQTRQTLIYEDFFKDRETTEEPVSEFLKLTQIDTTAQKDFGIELEYPNNDNTKKVRFKLESKNKAEQEYEELM